VLVVREAHDQPYEELAAFMAALRAFPAVF
jgi:hypothetical protein